MQETNLDSKLLQGQTPRRQFVDLQASWVPGKCGEYANTCGIKGADGYPYFPGRGTGRGGGAPRPHGSSCWASIEPHPFHFKVSFCFGLKQLSCLPIPGLSGQKILPSTSTLTTRSDRQQTALSNR
eukprot:1161958-Pelagomonas_calceolata.AAC.1